MPAWRLPAWRLPAWRLPSLGRWLPNHITLSFLQIKIT